MNKPEREMDITTILTKVEELKALFVMGQRVIPFLEELFVFVNDVSPLLDDINTSIEENLQRFPKASKQLSKVTEATELATSEIMDVVDGLNYKTVVLDTNHKQVQTIYLAMQHACSSAYEIAESGLKTGNTTSALQKVLTILDEQHTIDSDSVFTNTDLIIKSVASDASNIMMSLQVQDITSQQIAAVNNVIETVQVKLSTILDRFSHSGVTKIVDSQYIGNRIMQSDEHSSIPQTSTMHRVIAFDPDAVDTLLCDGNERQSAVDDVFNSFSTTTSPVSQDDIDSLFNS